jgi:hypothetical protein
VDLDPGWLTDVLRRSGTLPDGVAVTAVEETPVGTGQLGDCRRLVLTYDAEVDAPATLVAKVPSSDETSRATGMAMRTYETEVRFYQELAATVDVRAPGCHHAEYHPDTGDFVLLLEDLAPAEQGDQVAGCTVEAAASVLEEAVRLHAPRWGDPALGELEWLERYSEEGRDQLRGLLTVLFPNFVERYADRLDGDVLAMGERFIDRLDDYYERRPEPLTVVHNDFRLDNMLFDGDAVAVVDWQTVGRGPAMADVSYFLGAGLTTDDRRAHEEDLLRGYHAGLAASGIEGYSWDRLWADYRLFAFAGFHMAVLASMIVQRTDRGDDMFMAMAQRHGRHVLDLEAEALL